MTPFLILIILALLFAVASLVKPEAPFRLCSVAVLLVTIALLIGKA